MAKKGMDYFKALYDVARVINASLKPEEVLAHIVKCAAKAMEVKACSLRVLDSKRERLLMGGSWGLSEGYIRKGPVLVKESGLDQKRFGERQSGLKMPRRTRISNTRARPGPRGSHRCWWCPSCLGKRPSVS